MADVRPLNSLRYDLDRVGGLEAVLSPPYDVIDPAQRAELAARSPFNVVGIDLPEPATAGGDPYEHAATLLAEWQQAGALVRDEEPSFWILTQDYLAPDGNRRTRSGFLAAVKIEEYGAGKIRPHERTHPGPKEDRLRLTRATKTNLSPIFALYSDATGGARATIAAETESGPYGEQIDEDGTINRLWRVSDLDAQAALSAALDPAELLIADGHHRYETARIYADEIGGDGPHRFVMMDLVALEDPGLSVFPTHRLVSGLADDPERANALIQRGHAFAQSRAICGVHWQSDVQAGMLVGAGVVAQLHNNADFNAQLGAARQEVAAARANNANNATNATLAQDCAAEAAALAR